MGELTLGNLRLNDDETLVSDDMGLGYVSCDHGHKALALVLFVNSKQGRMALAHPIDAEDVDALCDTLRLLRDKIGTGEWPDAPD